ncbi:MAG TPA: D-galactarate dehydratase [Sporomusaceae bacterium]|nr:D-galactarate dehydratase [Sporomusaceae bacterium]
MGQNKAVVMHPADNVATAVVDLTAGSEVCLILNGEQKAVLLKDNIPFGHKFALNNIALAARVMKYGESIGAASRGIEEGEHVHIHNMVGLRGRGDLKM